MPILTVVLVARAKGKLFIHSYKLYVIIKNILGIIVPTPMHRDTNSKNVKSVGKVSRSKTENVAATVAFEKIRGEITGARNELPEQVTYCQHDCY